MTKGYYIHFDSRKEPGLEKKINTQINELKKVSLVEEINICERYPRNSIFFKVINNLPFIYPCKYNYKNVVNGIVDPQYIYVRRTYADKYYIQFLASIKKKYPKVKLIVELPTYPYFKDDYAKIKSFTKLLKELHAIPKFRQHIDRFATYSGDELIFGIKTLRIKNGIDVDSVAARSIMHSTNDTINLLAVATFRKHHGYERVIEGLAKYYNDGGIENIQLRLVGEGPERNKYETMVKKCNLENHVHFLGKLTGDDLDNQYAIADIALGSFGMYKIGVHTSSVLKIREYLAKGLPIVSGCYEDVFEDENFIYYLSFDNNNKIIDIEKIVAFYYSLYSDKDVMLMTKNIRDYARKYINYDVVFKSVLDYISN